MELKISSLSDKYIIALIKLKDKKNSLNERKFLIEGKNVITEALKVGAVETILFVDKKRFKFNNQIQINQKILNKLSSLSTSQNEIAVCKMSEQKINSKKRLILLDGINIPSNIGSIIRSGLAFNFDGVIASNTSAYIYNPKTIFASQGALFHLPIIQTDLIEFIKKNDLKIISTDLGDDSIELSNLVLEEDIAFVFGSETSGVSEEILNLSSKKIKIAIKNIDSLNVSIAAGIILNKYKI